MSLYIRDNDNNTIFVRQYCLFVVLVIMLLPGLEIDSNALQKSCCPLLYTQILISILLSIEKNRQKLRTISKI